MRQLASWKLPFVCALATVAGPIGLALLFRGPAATPPAAAPAPASAAAGKDAPVEISLVDALGRHWLGAEYRANGRDEVVAVLSSRYGAPLRLTFSAGLIFETADFQGQMAITSRQTVDLPPGGRREARLAAAATHLGNPLAAQVYHLCPDTLPALAPLFAQVDKTPEISRDAVQTAILMLTDNAPLGAFAKFALLAADAAKPSTKAFQVNNPEILAAFALVREAGYPRFNLVATRDPQLKIEAMIDPLSHAAAMDYYRINDAQEWAYWRRELQAGDPGTRHYALYGIGRYYPEVALQMLPAWARAKNLSALYRTSAMQAMAETRRPEAISVLHGLVGEFGAASELGQSARKAIAYLENQRTSPGAAAMLVGFRISQADVR